MTEGDDTEPRCASCGMSDDINLKLCTACKLVRYCSIKCQKQHRSRHKRVCKERAAELHDEILFRQPESSHLGDCPICCLPHSIDSDKSKAILMGCCSKMICNGCHHANKMRQIEGALDRVCLFCRHPTPSSIKECHKLMLNRVEANDPHSLFEMGDNLYKEGDIAAGIKFWKKSAQLGYGVAHFRLAMSYHTGEGVDKNLNKEIYHLEQAAIAGHPEARYNLGCLEKCFGRTERALKHYTIASNLGLDPALKEIRAFYADGKVRKEDFATAIRSHQAVLDATKSVQRSKAAADPAPN